MGDAPPNWPAAMRMELAAAYLDVGKTYFLATIAPALRPIRPTPKVVLYRRADLDAWLDRQAGAGAASAPATDSWAGV